MSVGDMSMRRVVNIENIDGGSMRKNVDVETLVMKKSENRLEDYRTSIGERTCRSVSRKPFERQRIAQIGISSRSVRGEVQESVPILKGFWVVHNAGVRAVVYVYSNLQILYMNRCPRMYTWPCGSRLMCLEET